MLSKRSARAGAAAETLNELPRWARDTAIARAHILRCLAEFARHAGVSEGAARARFAALYNDRPPELSDARLPGAPDTISAPTLKSWAQAYRRGGLVALAPGHGNRRGCGIVESNPAVADLVIAMVTHFGAHLRVPRVVEAIAAKFPELPTPSRGAVARFIRGWRAANPSLALALHAADKWKGSHRVKIADAGAEIVRLNQEWQIDGTPGDVMCVDGRYHILAIIDVYSRRVMFHVAPSEGTQAAIRLICRAMLAWGVPEVIHGDNGSGFVSKRAQAFLRDLDVTYVASPPFRPETKPFVESVIKTMSHELLEMLPGFCGHSVAQRQELRSRTSFAARFGAPAQKLFEMKLTAAELQEKLDTWATAVYGDRPHAGLAGRTPNEVAAAWGVEARQGPARYGEPRRGMARQGEVRKIGDERALAMLAEDAVVRRLGREGVAVAGARFVATPETIGEYVAHIGENALIYPDPSGDMGRHFVFLDTPAGRQFLCVVENVERLGYDRSNLAILARQAQDKFIRERRAEIRRVKNRIKPETVIDAHLALAAERHIAAATSYDAHDIVLHETAALAAASVAAAAAEFERPAANWSTEELASLDEADRIREAAERERAEAAASEISDEELFGAFILSQDSTDGQVLAWRRSFEGTESFAYFSNWRIAEERPIAEWRALGERGLKKLRAGWAGTDASAAA